MNVFFPEDHLTRSMPEETRIVSLEVKPYPDGRRVSVSLEVTPFQKRPHIEVDICNADGDEVASTMIVEPMSWKMEFTMHLRGEIKNPFRLEARLFYPEGPSAEPRVISFNVEPARGEFDLTE